MTGALKNYRHHSITANFKGDSITTHFNGEKSPLHLLTVSFDSPSGKPGDDQLQACQSVVLDYLQRDKRYIPSEVTKNLNVYAGNPRALPQFNAAKDEDYRQVAPVIAQDVSSGSVLVHPRAGVFSTEVKVLFAGGPAEVNAVKQRMADMTHDAHKLRAPAPAQGKTPIPRAGS